MKRSVLVQLIAVAACVLLVTSAPAAPLGANLDVTPRASPDTAAPKGHKLGRQRMQRSFEGHPLPNGLLVQDGEDEVAPANDIHHGEPKRRAVGQISTETPPPGLWLVSPDAESEADAASSDAVDYRTERYHISDLFEEGRG
ncbi:uncharacterized protein LOC119104653 [Pollicipes pollicipes]|uniref:uncharacterized protein LOC119104653 n=1 Tax=Pollicipes pollicipes TaxID=41117 RepID=UPI001884E626|nr:uncharacterized protein LOC119104653 [Pollicipes pollicipes]